MKNYRMAIQANICVSVEANTDEDAIAAAKKIAADMEAGDGYNLDTGLDGDEDLDARLYVHAEKEVFIEDREE